ncbi:MAG TPA: AI-2E family transporter, partial [Oscillibacter sp.]|nr:AI-2E family transporter [Oscillibacter sp.]
MDLELNKRNIKRIMLLIAFAALLYWGLNNLSWLGDILGGLVSLLSPLLIGICIAFVLNLMMAALERLWSRALAKWSSPWRDRLKRPVCLTLTMVLFVGIIFAIFFILIPRLEEAGT